MSPERVLLGVAVAVLAVSVVAAAAVPGALALPDPQPDDPGRFDVRDMAVAPGEVGGQTAEFHIETRLAHFGPRAENVSLELRATRLESGLFETSTTVPVEPVEGDREVTVNGTLRVERTGGYRIEAIVYHDGRRLGGADASVEGVDGLRPAYAESPVDFHQFRTTDQPAIEYRIADSDNETATLDVTTYLTNDGDASAGDLRLVLQARQSDSGIVADSTEVTVGQIEAGRTDTPDAALTVPDGYNYYLDAQLWADGVIVGEARAAANLDPAETLTVEQTRREVDLEVSDFEGADRRPAPDARATETGGQPGFTAGLALVAVLGAVLLARRYHA